MKQIYVYERSLCLRTLLLCLIKLKLVLLNLSEC